MREHRQRHKQKSKFQCPRCSYSASRQIFVNRHLEKDHRKAIAKDLTMLQRVQVMSEKVFQAKKEVDSISDQLDVLRKRKTEVQNRKDATQAAAFRTLDAQFRLAAGGEASGKDLAEVEDKVHHSWTEVDQVEAELFAMEEEETALNEDLTSAVESHFGAQEVLSILQTQINNGSS